MQALAYSLTATETQVLRQLLAAVRRLMEAGGAGVPARDNAYARAFEEAGGASYLEVLETHDDDGIYQDAAHLADTYFSDIIEADNEDFLAMRTRSVFGSGSYSSGAAGAAAAGTAATAATGGGSTPLYAASPEHSAAQHNIWFFE